MKVAVTLALAGAVTARSVDHVAERRAFVAEINKLATTWNATTNHRWNGQPIGAFKPLLGVKGDNMAVLNASIASGEIVVSDYVRDDIPESFEAGIDGFTECNDVIHNIRDQSNCGCCWAFGTAEAASDRMCIASKGALKMPLSAQDLCFNSNFNGCGGGQPSSAWNYIHSSGIVTGGQYQSTEGYCSNYALPHCHHHGPQGQDPYPAEGAPGCPSQRSPRGPKACDSTASPQHSNFDDDQYTFTGARVTAFRNEKAIQTAIMTDGPVTTAFTVYSDFENYAGGIYQHTKGRQEGGHAVKMVGWGVENGVKYWTVINSWNKFWGEDGAFRIIRGQDECGIEAQAVASGSGAVYGKK